MPIKNVIELATPDKQIAKAAQVIKEKGAQRVAIILNHSDYNNFSDYGEDVAYGLECKLKTEGIDVVVRHIYDKPPRDPNSTTYKLFCNPEHTKSELWDLSNLAYDGFVIISSEGILREGYTCTLDARAEFAHFLRGLNATKKPTAFVNPYPNSIRTGPMPWLIDSCMSTVVAHSAKSLHSFPVEEIDKLIQKAKRLEVITGNMIWAFLQEYGKYKEYLQVAKIMLSYRMVCAKRVTAGLYPLQGKRSEIHTSVDALQKQYPQIPAYVFVNVYQSSLFQRDSTIAYASTDVKKFFEEIPDSLIA